MAEELRPGGRGVRAARAAAGIKPRTLGCLENAALAPCDCEFGFAVVRRFDD